ncbi:MAG: SOS response-associated peptidase, partial [Bacteroidetes bacterium]
KILTELPFIESISNLRLSYNIAPTQHAFIITDDAPRRLQYVTWGLIPYWSNDGKNEGKLINARSEGIESKPSFRMPIRKRRCLVLADSFYEWKREGLNKIPYRIFRKDRRLLIMAGVWDVWYREDYAVKSFAILTTTPNEEMSRIHRRMPVIFSNLETYQRWLSNLELPEVLEMLHPPPDNTLDMYRVSEKVNSVKNDMPELHHEIPEPPTLFG